MGSAARNARARTTNRAIIDKLADELDLLPEQVEPVYLEHLHRIESEARIKTFVTVLAAGSTRSQLRRHRPH